MTLTRYQDTCNGCEENDKGDFVKHEDMLELIFKILNAVGEQGNDTVSHDYITGRTDAEAAILGFLDEENGGTY